MNNGETQQQMQDDREGQGEEMLKKKEDITEMIKEDYDKLINYSGLRFPPYLDIDNSLNENAQMQDIEWINRVIRVLVYVVNLLDLGLKLQEVKPGSNTEDFSLVKSNDTDVTTYVGKEGYMLTKYVHTDANNRIKGLYGLNQIDKTESDVFHTSTELQNYIIVAYYEAWDSWREENKSLKTKTKAKTKVDETTNNNWYMDNWYSIRIWWADLSPLSSGVP